MIERFYLKDYLSFEEAALDFQKGLVVFSGPSGSGKSILIEAILSAFGLSTCEARLCEASVTWKIKREYGIENEEINVFKQIKKEKTRYFINAQSVSKKTIASIASEYVRFLRLKEYEDFSNENLLDTLDNRIAAADASIKTLLSRLRDTFRALEAAKKELREIEEEERRIVDLKEFAAFEIEKIERIDPNPQEYDELMQVKKELSKKEKAQAAIERATAIFEHEFAVSEALDLLDEDGAFFDDAMNDLRSRLESAAERFSALEEVNVEEVLDRLEQLSELKRKYGGIEEALRYLERKKEELAKYENIEFQKKDLQERIRTLQARCDEDAKTLREKRMQELPRLNAELTAYAKRLYLAEVALAVEEKELDALGRDRITLSLADASLAKISTGEFNRLRLALLAIRSELLESEGGVLVLDEIDANLSGEESMSVAKVLRKLAKKYQIFVITHQPQLTSQGEQHFLVSKNERGISSVRELSYEDRIKEIARIISGDAISQEALKFAEELMGSTR